MDRDNLIQLTNKLYHLTQLFPKKDPLRYKMRKIALDIFEGVNSCKEKDKNVIDKIKTLNCFFEVVKKLNWVKLDRLLEVQEEYIKMESSVERDSVIKEETIKLPIERDVFAIQIKGLESSKKNDEEEVKKEEIKKEETSKTVDKKDLSERHQKIIDVLKEKEKAQVGDFKKIFSNISKRTLRRDFNYLMDQGLVERIGERNETFYKLKDRTY